MQSRMVYRCPSARKGAELLDAKVGDQDLDDLLTEAEDDQDNGKEANGKAGGILAGRERLP